MKRTLIVLCATLASLAAAAPYAAGQDSKELVPLKVDFVISRQAGEKKVSSMPYSLWLTANGPRQGTSLRMGVRVPIPTTTVKSVKEGENPAPVQSYTYQDVGTNIDATAVTATGGRYLVEVTLSNTSIDEKQMSSGGLLAPAFRNFTSRFSLLLRDGQTATYTSATDPITGETLKVDVTLTALK